MMDGWMIDKDSLITSTTIKIWFRDKTEITIIGLDTGTIMLSISLQIERMNRLIL